MWRDRCGRDLGRLNRTMLLHRQFDIFVGELNNNHRFINFRGRRGLHSRQFRLVDGDGRPKFWPGRRTF